MDNKQKTGLKIGFDNSYARQLAGFYVTESADKSPAPKLIKYNITLAKQLGLKLDDEQILGLASGNVLPVDASPLAQAYAGHQFGHFSPQLGDGRALLLGELIGQSRARVDIQLKGSGATAFSRGGDGKAAIGPVLREYLISEAMFALKIPTTRALAAVTTGSKVFRDKPLPGAILTRVAASHIRIGSFQFYAARGEIYKVKQLADYAIERHYPQIVNLPYKYLQFLKAVIAVQANLVAKWMLVGFIHGVMNTDNMSISGETIDYGPCAFMDNYAPDTVFSSIDQNGRYAYQNQPKIAIWNLARLAECLLPLMDTNKDNATKLAVAALDEFEGQYENSWLKIMREKIGLTEPHDEDLALCKALLIAMLGQNVDYTQLFRALSGSDAEIIALFDDDEQITNWLQEWRARCAYEAISVSERVARMNAINPIYIVRNHLIEEALSAATFDQDYSKFEKLLAVVSQPFQKIDGLEDFAQKAPKEFSDYKTFCGT